MKSLHSSTHLPSNLCSLVLLAPVSLPILSIEATDRYARAATLGALEDAYEVTGALPPAQVTVELEVRAR